MAAKDRVDVPDAQQPKQPTDAKRRSDDFHALIEHYKNSTWSLDDADGTRRPWREISTEGKLAYVAAAAAVHDVPLERFAMAARDVLGDQSPTAREEALLRLLLTHQRQFRALDHLLPDDREAQSPMPLVERFQERLTWYEAKLSELTSHDNRAMHNDSTLPPHQFVPQQAWRLTIEEGPTDTQFHIATADGRRCVLSGGFPTLADDWQQRVADLHVIAAAPALRKAIAMWMDGGHIHAFEKAARLALAQATSKYADGIDPNLIPGAHSKNRLPTWRLDYAQKPNPTTGDRQRTATTSRTDDRLTDMRNQLTGQDQERGRDRDDESGH